MAVSKNPAQQFVALSGMDGTMQIVRVSGANDGIKEVEVAATNSRGYQEDSRFIDFRRAAPTDKNQIWFDAKSGTINIADPSIMAVRQYQIVELKIT